MPLLSTTNLIVDLLDTVPVARIRCEKIGDFEAPGLLSDLQPLAPAHRGRMVVDLADVMLLGSSGIGFLLSLRKACEEHKGKLALCGLSSEIEGMLKISNLLALFTIKKTPAEAAKAVK